MLYSTTLTTILTVLSVFYPPAAFMIASIGSLIVAIFLARDLFAGTPVVLESRPRRERAGGS
jgi:hypothetical protein